MSKITAIAGPMFSKKTTRLVTRIVELNSAGGLVFKHAADQARSAGRLSSHDPSIAGVIEATPINSLYQILEYVDTGTMHVFIDEAQFFPAPEAMKFLAIMREKHPTVSITVAGLDRDWRGEPFAAMEHFVKSADESVVCTAVCAQCASDATMSYFKQHATSTPGVGGAAAYEPRCAMCHAYGMGQVPA